MKTYTFPAGGSLGKWESWDGTFDLEISDEDATRMEKAIMDYPEDEFDECDAISDIYDRVCALALQEQKRIYIKDGLLTELRRDCDYYRDLSDEDIVDAEMGRWSVSYPEELMNSGE